MFKFYIFYIFIKVEKTCSGYFDTKNKCEIAIWANKFTQCTLLASWNVTNSSGGSSAHQYCYMLYVIHYMLKVIVICFTFYAICYMIL